MENNQLKEALDVFFIEDGHVSEGFIHKSVLLQMIRDLQFSLGIGREGWASLHLDSEQEKIKKKMLPLLTPILLFNSSVDLLARVKLRRITKLGENRKVFEGLLKNYFSFSVAEAKVLWDFRCSLSHQYTIPTNVALYRAGSHKIIERVGNADDLWFIYVHAMYTSLKQVKAKIYEETIALGEKEQALAVDFIKAHGLIKQQRGIEAKSSE